MSQTVRREPPPFRRVAVYEVVPRTPRLIRVTLAGPELEGLTVDEPAASVRLLIPSEPGGALVVPEWTGNEFLLPDGTRPRIRTLTPRSFDPAGPALDVEIVLHDEGALSDWARSAGTGDPAAVSGTGRGYEIDPEAERFVLAGDETAIPAISQLIEEVDDTTPVEVHLEIAHPDARLEFAGHPDVRVHWHERSAGTDPGDALVPAIEGLDLAEGTKVWVAGEAAAVQRIRRHLKDDRGLGRSDATVRGYWKAGREGT